MNSGITAAVSNVKSIYCGVSGGVQQAECDYSSSAPNPGQEEDEVDAGRVFNFMWIKLIEMLRLFTRPWASFQHFIPPLLESFCLQSVNFSRTKEQPCFQIDITLYFGVYPVWF